jgi:murein DD-endopeptidase MepM/ murein hydrolase activator NlpD
MALPADAEVDAYITQRAQQYGISPQIAVQVSRAERASRSTGWIGDHGTSFGPYQLHYGGGLGEVFTSRTGLDARDIERTWRQQVDFALSYAAQHSWEPWHAAKAIGIGTWDGIRRGVTTVAQAATTSAQALQYYFPVVGYTGNPRATYHTPGASDLFAPEGTPVRALVSGKVETVGSSGPGGNNIQIRGIDGLTYYYAHLKDRLSLHAGDFVAGGQQIGAVGRTGNAASTDPHLHIGIGYGIRDGEGAAGGTGINFDAQSFLSNLLNNAGAAQDAVGAATDTVAGVLNPGSVKDLIGTAITSGFDTIHQGILNYVQDRAATIVLMVAGIFLILAGIWGLAMRSDTVRTVVKTGTGIVNPVAGAVAGAAL